MSNGPPDIPDPTWMQKPKLEQLEPYQYLVQPMTLRDYFAGQALAGGAVRYRGEFTSLEELAAKTAKTLYTIADAMIAERDK